MKRAQVENLETVLPSLNDDQRPCGTTWRMHFRATFSYLTEIFVGSYLFLDGRLSYNLLLPGQPCSAQSWMNSVSINSHGGAWHVHIGSIWGRLLPVIA